jgi:hypothetical protein
VQHSALLAPRFVSIVEFEGAAAITAQQVVTASFVHGNLHITFASVTADHSTQQTPAKRIVSARMVMPIIGAIELRDLLTQLIEALTAQGVIGFAHPAYRSAHRAGGDRS